MRERGERNPNQLEAKTQENKMGKSASCLKLPRCLGSSADRDDLDVSENKSSGDKKLRGFQSRSERRVLGNNVVSQTPSGQEEIPGDAAVKLQQSEISINHDKTPTTQIVEEKLQQEPAESKNPEVVVAANGTEVRKTEPVIVASNETEVGVNVDESVVVIVQTAVRRYLAHKKLKELKSVIKLQAAVRGHLVRRHAIGALCCVQAIVKMQVLVRNRFARQSIVQPSEKKPDGKDDQERVSPKPTDSGTSIDKLLSNRFARQLMESTPKTKPVKIKCDPLKPNSAWTWLERWMSVSLVEPKSKLESTTEQPENEKSENNYLAVDAELPSKVASESTCTKSNEEGTMELPYSEESLIYSDSSVLKFDACQPASVKEILEHCEVENAGMPNPEETSVELHPISDPVMQTYDANSEPDRSYPLHKPETDTEQVKHSIDVSVSKQLETEQMKFITESRKASNPAFIDAHSKFEDPSSSSRAVGLMSASDQDVAAESSTDVSSSAFDTLSRTNELGMTGIPVHDISRVRHGDSEFGTGPSVSSALDSPGRSKIAAKGCVIVAEEGSSSTVPNLSNLETDQLEKLVSDGGESIDSMAVAHSAEVTEQQQKGTSDIQTEPDIGADDRVYTSYPEASPKSHTSISVQGTPSSQVSVKVERGKNEMSGHKRKSLSANKGSPENPANDSGSRRSAEHLPREQKNGKRRNYFGSPKPDPSDQEQKDINRYNSLPRFMQATESARAKINANSSPRSSPDVHDQDTCIKKRHSLPGANVKHGSPEIKRSLSQAQHDVKEKERKWLR